MITDLLLLKEGWLQNLLQLRTSTVEEPILYT